MLCGVCVCVCMHCHTVIDRGDRVCHPSHPKAGPILLPHLLSIDSCGIIGIQTHNLLTAGQMFFLLCYLAFMLAFQIICKLGHFSQSVHFLTKCTVNICGIYILFWWVLYPWPGKMSWYFQCLLVCSCIFQTSLLPLFTLALLLLLCHGCGQKPVIWLLPFSLGCFFFFF